MLSRFVVVVVMCVAACAPVGGDGDGVESAPTSASPSESEATSALTGFGADSPFRTCKRGLAYEYKSAADLGALSSSVGWWYNWSLQADGSVAGSRTSEFVPMVWGRQFSVGDAVSRISDGATTLLGFNEPNFFSQASITAQDAAGLWPQLQDIARQRHLKLASPAVNYCGGGCNETDPFRYLDAFFAACPGCQVDYIAAHWYACTGDALRNYLSGLKRYGRPIWLTEFSCGDQPDQSLPVQQNYMREAVNILENDPAVVRYAWFSGRTNAIGNVNLFGGDGQLTELGREYVSLPTSCSSIPTGLVSLRVTTAGFTDRTLRHQGDLGVTAQITGGSDTASRQDASFWIRPGLAKAGCYSFEARNAPGQFLRHASSRIRLAGNDGSDLFRQDATFCPRAGLSGTGTSLESYNFPGRFIRHINAEVYIAARDGGNPWDGGGSFDADASWNVDDALWRSGVDLPVDQPRTFQVVNPGLTDRVLRHQNGVAVTSAIASSDGLGKSDATFYIRAGLADASCYSLESANFRGSYLRHANFRVRLDGNDGSQLFRSDATFCAQPGVNGDLSLVPLAVAGRYVRHKNGEVWIGVGAGSDPGDGFSGSFASDATWRVVGALAP